jgi:hypothetical protein
VFWAVRGLKGLVFMAKYKPLLAGKDAPKPAAA